MPDLIEIYVGADWQAGLAAAQAQAKLIKCYFCEEAVPALALPESIDPAAYHWPVAGRDCAIYGCLPPPRLRRLLAALLRDGAAVAAGLNTDKELHTARPVKAKAAA